MVTGVVVVTYNARDIVLDCVESLLASQDADLRIVIVDNASSDDTVDVIRNWAETGEGWSPTNGGYFTPVDHKKVDLVDHVPSTGLSQIALIVEPVNLGFAGGVNVGLRLLKDDPEVDYFWVLNPDCVAENQTAARLENAARNAGEFGLIGGRVYYKDPALMIQCDGGRINFNTGTCIPFNMTKVGRDVLAPESSQLDYISGAHIMVSRLFLEQAGLMPEEYFLYYEEMDWCTRRGDLPMHFCAEAAVHHDGGHTLGSATINNGPSTISAYFMGRSRMRFVWKYRPVALPLAFAYGVLKSVKFMMKGQVKSGRAFLRGVCGFKPSKEVQTKLRLNVTQSEAG